MPQCDDCDKLVRSVSFSFIWEWHPNPTTNVSHIFAVRPIASKKLICAPWFDTDFEEINQCLRLAPKTNASKPQPKTP